MSDYVAIITYSIILQFIFDPLCTFNSRLSSSVLIFHLCPLALFFLTHKLPGCTEARHHMTSLAGPNLNVTIVSPFLTISTCGLLLVPSRLNLIHTSPFSRALINELIHFKNLLFCFFSFLNINSLRAENYLLFTAVSLIAKIFSGNSRDFFE
jgi:hypothetical protein